MHRNDVIPLAIAGLGLLGLLATATLALQELAGPTSVPAPAPAPRRAAAPLPTPRPEPEVLPPLPSPPVPPATPGEGDVCGTAGPSLGEQLELAQRRAADEAREARARELARREEHTGGAPLGCSKLVIWEGGSARGRIVSSGVVSRDDQVAGKVLADGRVIARDVLLGEVDAEGRVSFDRKAIGRIDANGDVWRSREWVGRVREDGQIVWRGLSWGRVEGYTGSAPDRRAVVAYLLLFSGTFK